MQLIRSWRPAEASFREQQDLIGAMFGMVGAQPLVSTVGSDAPRLVFVAHAAIAVEIFGGARDRAAAAAARQ